MTHTPALEAVHNQPPLPNQQFSSWLRGQTTLFVSQIIAVLGFVLFLGEEFYYVSHLSEQRELLEPLTITLVVDYAHVFFITLFIVVLIRVLDENDRGSHRVRLVYKRVFDESGEPEGGFEAKLEETKQQLRRFKRRFLWFWIGMLFLYVFFACQHSYKMATSLETGVAIHGTSESKEETSNVHDSGENAAAGKSISTTPPLARTSSQSHPLPGNAVLKKLSLPFVVFVFNNVTLLFIYWCFLVMDIPSSQMTRKYYKHRNWSGAFMLLLTALFPLLAYFNVGRLAEREWSDFVAIFDALSGVTNGLVLALLIARLDSKLIGLPSWLICILYSYAAVQPLFMVFELGSPSPEQITTFERITTTVLIFVFISKIYFFLIIIYALQTGKMLNYLFCFPILADRAEESEVRLLPVDEAVAHRRIFKDGLRPGRVTRLLNGCDVLTARSVSYRRIRKLRRTISCWLGSKQPLTISKLVGVMAVSYFFLSLLHALLVLDRKDAPANIPNGFNVAIDYAQLTAVLLMVVTLVLVRHENSFGVQDALQMGEKIFKKNLNRCYSPKQAQKQLIKFKQYFLYFWCTTFLLYLAFLLDHQKLSFFSEQPQSIGLMLKTLLFPFLEYLLSTLNLLFVFWCFVIFQSPAFNTRDNVRQNLLLNYSSFAIALVIAAFPLLLFMIGGPVLLPDKMREYATVFDGLTGTLSAIVLALLIARMDSKLFRLPNWSTALLFTYAAIQPLFVAFALQRPVLDLVQTSVLTAALGFKICLFLIVLHSLQSGRALNYLVCFPFLRDRVDSIFENQFEVRLARSESDLFSVSIFKKNVVYYSIERKFHTRTECDELVCDLRKRMQNRAAYTPSVNGTHPHSNHEGLGTYWVELRSDDGDLLCESIPLRSEVEAEELIAESMEKIPYCKYNRA